MIKQIFNKVSRKQSKFSNYQESSGTQNPDLTCSSSKGSDLAGGNSGKLSNSDISSPLNIRFNLNDTNFRNGGHLSVSYESLPSFRDVRSSKKQKLFIKKVIMCSVIFDFTDPTKNLKEKEIKRQTLLELVDFVASGNVKFTASAKHEFVKMVSANLFREFTRQPRACKILQSCDLKEEGPSIDPSWPHLQIVYELLQKFIASPNANAKFAKKFIDNNFLLKFLDLFDSENPRERRYLMTILHRIYTKFWVHRSFIRKSINDIFYNFVFETEQHNGIWELLQVLASIVSGFCLPLGEEQEVILSRVLIPLHKPKCLAMYHEPLSYCITQFVEKDCNLADMVIRGLLKYWPVTNSSKEILFLGELEEVLEVTKQPQFHLCMVPLFKQINRCLSSSHFQVAERATSLIDNDHIQSLIRQNHKVILPLIFPAVVENWRYHWNQSVRSLSLDVWKIFMDLEPDMFDKYAHNYNEELEEENKIRSRRKSTWKHLKKIAADRASRKEIC